MHLVSQFTLLAKTTKGTKPDFHGAANPEEARRLYQLFVQKVQAGYQADRVKDGRFQAMMEVALVNDGPVGYDSLPTVFQGVEILTVDARLPWNSTSAAK